METQFFIYLAKVNGALLLFYLLYIAVFRHDTFIRLRRSYLLSAVLFSLLYPLFTVDSLGGLFSILQSRQPVEATIELGEPTVLLLESDAAGFTVPWRFIVQSILLLGSLFFAFRLIMQVVSIVRIRRRCREEVISGYKILNASHEITPFSFFKWIIVNTDAHSEEELQQILIHESTHVRQWHSADVLLGELLSVFFWWNPAVWLLKREIVINLEYLADNDVLQHGVNSREYQYHLLKLTYHETAVPLSNHFNVSQLKQRITMMNKTQSPAVKLAKYLTVIPLVLLLITLNSCLSKEKQTDEKSNDQTEELQNSSSKNDIKADVSEGYVPPVTDSQEEIFSVVEEQPLYPGGNAAMMKFLSNNIKYPVAAQEKGTQGRVITNFVVEKDGSLSDIQVIRGVDPSLDAEALRVLKTMPKWKPGKQKGEEVRVRFTLPVVFRLQSPPPPPPPPPTPVKESGSNDVFVVVEKQPKFPGGNAAMMKFLSDNIKYPAEAQEKGIHGRIITNFVVEKDGSLNEVKVVRGVDPLLDAEAVRVIQSMPNWKPGTQKGETVRVRYTLPVVFRLQQ